MGKKKAKHLDVPEPGRARGIAAAAGALVGGFFVKRKLDENAFRNALVRGLHDVAGSGIVRDPHGHDEPWPARSS